MKNLSIIIIAIIIVAVGTYFIFRGPSAVVNTPPPAGPVGVPPEPVPPVATSSVPQTSPAPAVGEVSIGNSVDGQPINAYHYGIGDTEVLFIGGIHGGYSWNTALVAYQLIDYLNGNPGVIPSNMRVSVIPVLNPDGLKKVVGTAGLFSASDVPTDEATTVPGRFNAHNVDLNRNFDCDWQSDATWQNRKVNGGANVFSEPESQAIKTYVEKNKPAAVVVWYSAAGGVFASSCHNGVLPETKVLTDTFATASGYKPYQEFNFYEITGDMINWLAKQNIPAISVLLTNHTSTEWIKNKAGIEAIIAHYAK